MILHTHGACAYKIKLPCVTHDNVAHKKTKVLVKGKLTWVLKFSLVSCPVGKKLRVKSGTKIIDRIWGHIRSYLKNFARRVGNIAFA